jgi:parallel beta-helix repeat protein
MVSKTIACIILGMFLAAGVVPNIFAEVESCLDTINKTEDNELPTYVEVDDDAPPEWYELVNHTNDIQDAINMVELNGTVFVHNGTYITPKKAFLIDKSLNLKGENKNNTIIKGYLENECIIIASLFVNISGFKIIEGGSSAWLAGIKIVILTNDKKTINIFDNIISGNSNGIYLTSTEPNVISNTSVNIFDNEIFNNVNDGIILVGNNNHVWCNEIYNNGNGGIDIWSSDNNTIEFNIIHNNSYYYLQVLFRHLRY